MKVRWSRRAIRALEDIRSYIAEDNPSAAEALWHRVRACGDTTLAEHPFSGRPGRVDGTRELIIRPSYIMVYSVTADIVDILTIRHVAQRWPNEF